MQTGQATILIGGRPQCIVCFLEKILCHEKAKVECGLLIQRRVGVQGVEKRDIRTN